MKSVGMMSAVLFAATAGPAWASGEPQRPVVQVRTVEQQQERAGQRPVAEPEQLQNEEPVATPDRTGKGYEPALPLLSNCTCASTNGTCNTTTCTITCNQGFFNCDNDLSNGCEATQVCATGGTTAGTKQDLGAGGNSMAGGCDVVGASAGTAGAFLLLGAAVLLARRRRS
jgi:MYXO-CTERM domain-containing protein